MVSVVERIEQRLRRVEADLQRRAAARAAWRALPLEQRIELLAAGMGYTTPDGLPYVTDYNLPADTPALSLMQANASQAALTNHRAVSDGAYMHGRTATQVGDWNAAVQSGVYVTGPGAANVPSTGLGDASWIGIVARLNDGYVHQIAWPATFYPVAAMLQRSCAEGVWTGWGRVTNWAFSWADLDNFVTHHHQTLAGNATVARFASGMKKDPGNTYPTANDEWRVQCYDEAGNFTWSAIKIPESGIVSMPRGHATATRALEAGDPLDPTQAATIGTVIQIVAALLAGRSIPQAEPTSEGD